MQVSTAVLRFGRHTIGIALLLGATSVPAFAQNLVTNGGFESKGVSGIPDGFANSGNCFLHMRTDIQQNAAHNGKYGVEFGANNCEGGYSQSLATIAGQQYTVSFFARVVGNAQPNDLHLTFGGATIFDQGITNGEFMQFTTTATATTNSTLFDIQGGMVKGTGYINFDDVSVTQGVTTTPEPGSMALLGTGLVGLIPMIRRKRS